MPLAGHRRDQTGHTAQVIDAFLAVDPREPLLVQWPVGLCDDDRGVLGKLLEALPYLGRSESLCVAELLDEAPPVDETWWRLGVAGPEVQQAQLLAPSAVTLGVLEQTTTGVRRGRRRLPEGTELLVYGRPQVPPPRVAAASPRTRVGAIRFHLAGTVGLRAGSAVLATDAMHGLVSKLLTTAGLDPVETAATLGLNPDGSILAGPHQHLHILALPDRPTAAELGRPLPARAETNTLVLWAPRGLDEGVAGLVVDRARRLYVPAHLEDQLPTRAILYTGAGSVDEMYRPLVSRSATWTSWLPYLPVRHRKKNQSDEQFLADDVRRECRFRELPDPEEIEPVTGAPTAGQIAQFRRRRNGQSADKRRRGVYLRLRFAEPVSGPVVLGQLSHFGYGVFLPAGPEVEVPARETAAFSSTVPD